MDDLLLTAAICGSRQAHDKLIGIGKDSADFSEAARCVVESAGEQYSRDSDLQAVDRDILGSQVRRRFGAGSMSDSVMEFVGRFPSDVSKINVVEEYRLLRLGRCATSLATMLATGQHGEQTQELLAKYQRLAAGEQGETFKERLTADDFEDDDAVRIPVYPPSLNDFIGGGVLRGHNITVYGRPDSGKSMFGLNMAASLCREGYKVLYVANEEPAQDITLRLIARLTQKDIVSLRDGETRREAFKRCRDAYRYWTLLHRAGCTVRDIARQCSRLRPDVVIIDQLKNLTCKEDNRALQLDRLARQVREIGIEHNCVTMSITQAGESADMKLVLSMGDVEWSNTGIPGAADLMIGIGLDQEFEATDRRMLSICKNKVNGSHGAFPVWIDPSKTAFLSKAKL